MRVFKIGIRQQLIALVLFVAACSLAILGTITGVYFSENYKQLRSDKLVVIAQLKSSQVTQSLNSLYYQAFYLTARDTLQNSLSAYRAGNKTDENWYNAQESIQEFLSSSNIYTHVRVYDTSFKKVINETNNNTGPVPSKILSELFPLGHNYSFPAELESTGILTGPVMNSTSYLLSMTLPVFSKASILVDSTNLAGYVSIVMKADSIVSTLADITTLTNGRVVILATDPYNSNNVNSTFDYLFESPEYVSSNNTVSSSYIATQLFRYNKTGSVSNTKNEFNMPIAAGFCPINFELARWAAIVEQPRSTFVAPSKKLTGIIVGVCVGTAVLMAIVTLPLAHWAVKPILRLQKASETIVAGRGLQRNPSNGGSGYGSKRNSRTSYGAGIGSGSDVSNLGEIENNIANSHQFHNYDSPGPGGTIPENSSTSSGVSHHQFTYLSNARVPVYSRFVYDEFSKLTETFNAMTDELDRQYSHLEDRVKARTKQLEAAKIEAETANEAKTVFIANISHELRTPLNGILGMTAIAMAEVDVSKIRSSLKLIFRSGELLLHILTELLTFSKNSLKRSKLENSDFTIMEVALQIKSIFGKLAKDQNVNLTITIIPNETRRKILYGDSNALIQIVMNLVSNALKFTPVEGSVTVTLKNLGEYDEAASAATHYEKVLVKSNSESENKNNSGLNEYEKEKIQISSNDDSSESPISPISPITKANLSTTEFEDEKLKTVELRQPKTWVFEFEVEDTGPGIQPELQKTVFEPFVQGDQTLSRQHGGTGLGLSICRQLASLMHGVMELKSTVGVGSKFICRVPILQTKEIIVDPFDESFYEDEFNADSRKNRKVTIVEPSGSDSSSTEITNTSDDATSYKNIDRNSNLAPPSEEDEIYNRPLLTSTGTARSSDALLKPRAGSLPVKNLKILVTEDNSVNQEVIKRMLNLEGFHNIDLAIDGQEAIDLVKERKGEDEYDIIFMDVQMPKVDGLMATRIIREELLYDGPIIALTAFADEANAKGCIEAGMSSFLSKPIRRSQLRHVILESCPFLKKDFKKDDDEESKIEE